MTALKKAVSSIQVECKTVQFRLNLNSNLPLEFTTFLLEILYGSDFLG